MISLCTCILLSTSRTNCRIFFLPFSATWPEGVCRLAQSYMKNPIQVYVGSLDLAVSWDISSVRPQTGF